MRSRSHENSVLGTKKSESTDSSGAPRPTPLPGKGPGEGSEEGAPWAQKKSESSIQTFFVPRTRLELARLKQALPPQSSVSTNFTIWALFGFRAANIHCFF